jgi:hypothetical protein
MMQKKYKKQIQTLIQVNNSHIQKQENEILKLVGKKNKLLEDLEQKERSLTKITDEKNHFKANYFKAMKVFGNEQVNFFRNSLTQFDGKITQARVLKDKTRREIEMVEANLLKHRNELKKYTYKNVKYDYLKVSFG